MLEVTGTKAIDSVSRRPRLEVAAAGLLVMLLMLPGCGDPGAQKGNGAQALQSWFGGGWHPDRDNHGFPDDEDNCPDVHDPLGNDLDLDGVGDVCDNCPTQPNPDQEDSNGDGSGDACAPSVEFDACGIRFVPHRGLSPALFHVRRDPGVHKIHPVVQFTLTPMEPQHAALEALGVTIEESFARNVSVVSVRPHRLFQLAALDFVRAVFPLPEACQPDPDDLAACSVGADGSWSSTRERGPLSPLRARHGLR